MASEAGGINGDWLLKAEKLKIEADGVTDDPPAVQQVDVESGKTDRKVRPEPHLKGGSDWAPSGEARVCWVCRGFEA